MCQRTYLQVQEVYSQGQKIVRIVLCIDSETTDGTEALQN
jgi:hypothetical protein